MKIRLFLLTLLFLLAGCSGQIRTKVYPPKFNPGDIIASGDSPGIVISIHYPEWRYRVLFQSGEMLLPEESLKLISRAKWDYPIPPDIPAEITNIP